MKLDTTALTRRFSRPLNTRREAKRAMHDAGLTHLKPITPAARKMRLAIVFLISVLICGVLDRTGQCGFDWLEQDAYSARMLWHTQRHPVEKGQQDIVLVTMSDETFANMGLSGPPMPRDHHAIIIRELSRAGASIIAFDLVFDVPRAEDKILAAAVRESKAGVLWACIFDNYLNLVKPVPELLNASNQTGHIIVPHDAERPAVDRIQAFESDRGKLIPAFSLQAALMKLGLDTQRPQRVVGGWQIGNFLVPADAAGMRDERGAFQISFLGRQGETFPTYRYEDIYQYPPSTNPAPPGDATGKKLLYDFKDKIVLIGDTTKVGNDAQYTTVGNMWGVETHAHAIATLLRGSFVHPAPLLANFAMLCALSAIVCFAVRVRRVQRVVLLVATLFLAYLIFNVWLFEQGIALHVVGPSAALLLTTLGVLIERNMAEEHEKERMFDTFVTAAASAIEVRDPSTSGHSRRVTALTMELARAVSATTEGPFKNVRFTPSQMRELRFATMLHDFGKIGVRENILTKSHKIEPLRFHAVTGRLLRLRDQRDKDFLLQKVKALLEHPREQADTLLTKIEVERQAVLQQLGEDLTLLERANDPTIRALPQNEYEALLRLLDHLAGMSYSDEKGRSRPLLTTQEMEALKIRRGSLSDEEYHQIQHHARMSFDFLYQIPWTAELQNIPEIAYRHHEKLNGKGYPRGILGEDIPLQTRIITIADIYDALTASDRAYKKALTPQQALQILRSEAADGGIDRDVLDVFISRDIYLVTQNALELTQSIPDGIPSTAETGLMTT